ncbi:hypothetical protein EDB80DRAFT_66814 [Ilyonectria destructans]|nr:hypothetical protein EDB80DRAFT_66814 [Ilyonectria destructans]
MYEIHSNHWSLEMCMGDCRGPTKCLVLLHMHIPLTTISCASRMKSYHQAQWLEAACAMFSSGLYSKGPLAIFQKLEFAVTPSNPSCGLQPKQGSVLKIVTRWGQTTRYGEPGLSIRKRLAWWETCCSCMGQASVGSSTSQTPAHTIRHNHSTSILENRPSIARASHLAIDTRVWNLGLARSSFRVRLPPPRPLVDPSPHPRIPSTSSNRPVDRPHARYFRPYI